MMYPYLTLNDQTEITHSEMKEYGSVKVYIETPDENRGFRSAVCWLPQYRWENIQWYLDAIFGLQRRLRKIDRFGVRQFGACKTGR